MTLFLKFGVGSDFHHGPPWSEGDEDGGRLPFTGF